MAIVNGGVWIQSHICLTLKTVLGTAADKAPERTPSPLPESGWACGQSGAKETERGPHEKGNGNTTCQALRFV